MNTRSNYYLSLHVETTGVNYDDPSAPVYEGHDIVALAAAVCEKDTFKKVDEIIVFFTQDPDRKDIGTRWHGITAAFLDEEGVDEIEAIEEFVSFLLDYFDVSESIICMGQNVHAFALPFIKNWLYSNEVFLKFSTCSLDVFSLTVATIGETSIEELIDTFGEVENMKGFQQRQEYACLLKVQVFIEAFRRIDKLCRNMIQ